MVGPDTHLVKDAYLVLRDELLAKDVKMFKREASGVECNAHKAETEHKRFFYTLKLLPCEERGAQSGSLCAAFLPRATVRFAPRFNPR